MIMVYKVYKFLSGIAVFRGYTVIEVPANQNILVAALEQLQIHSDLKELEWDWIELPDGNVKYTTIEYDKNEYWFFPYAKICTTITCEINNYSTKYRDED
jgi:hypothetical protein